MRFVAAAALLSTLAAADPSAAAFAVGVLRRDGIVIPYASFDGKRWSAPWPLPDSDRAIPINLISVPKNWWGKAGIRDSWQAWVDGATQTLHVQQPDVVKTHCTRQIGLRTDYRPVEPPPPPDVQPYPKDGLAISPSHELQRIAILSPGATELLPLWPAVRDAFNQAERETASHGNYPISEKVRERYDPQIEAAYAYGTDPRVYYVESTRAYRTVGNDDCAYAFGTGWFMKSGDSYKPLVMSVELLGCDRYGASYMLPFGVMSIGGHTYWLAQFSGWDDERFVVLDVKQKTVEAVVNVWEGGC